jgi:hypothetical protein
MSRRIGQLEDALEVMWIAAGKGGGMGSDSCHPLLKKEHLAVKVPPDTQNYGRDGKPVLAAGSSSASYGSASASAPRGTNGRNVVSSRLNERFDGGGEDDGDSLKEEELEDESAAIGLDGVLEGLMNINLSAEEKNERRRGERLGLSTMEVRCSRHWNTNGQLTSITVPIDLAG